MLATKPISVLIADDHALLRSGLRSLLESEAGIEVVGEAGDGQEAVDKAASLKPDVVLLDVNMPGLNGLQAARKLRSQAPGARIVVLTVSPKESFVAEAFRAGAKGYVVKDAPPEELVRAIRAAHENEVFLSPQAQRVVVGTPGEGEVTMVSDQLTRRELEVCRLLAAGNTVPEIAQIIGISRKTVDVHKTRLMKKLDVHNRAELVRYAIQNDLIDG